MPHDHATAVAVLAVNDLQHLECSTPAAQVPNSSLRPATQLEEFRRRGDLPTLNLCINGEAAEACRWCR